ncbi:hypothetical protein V495_02562 [Pseudogymnoascus sp. VKM F-4514 (FW-929)]|nr:hypothetical protein V495_02562 [Pseudogymnoascus sp. VKM F-4514 (FW-929)]KFY55587.1 hypothetical protein V497_06867 [Pseudogymnoascus sp. VKM F-4516 (FW-969)]
MFTQRISLLFYSLAIVLGIAKAASEPSDTPHTRQFFHIGGDYVSSGDGGHYFANQSYVEKLTPASGATKPYPLVFIHGIGQTGTNWLNKPDGKPGWSSYFLRQGYTIYLLDQPSHGRSPFLGPPINNYTHVSPLSAEVIASRFTAPELYSSYPRAELHTQWPGGPGSGVQGNLEFDTYFAATVPSLVANIPQQTAVRAAGAALLDRIGTPVIIIGHSQGGTMPWVIADARPGLVHAIVALEPAGPPFVEPALNGKVPARAWGMTDIPMAYEPAVADPTVDLVLAVTRANSTDEEDCWVQAESPAPRQLVNLKGVRALVITAEASWHVMYDWCSVKFLIQAGVETDHVSLADVGVRGNGHMLFLEMNSDESAGVVADWIERGIIFLNIVLRRSPADNKVVVPDEKNRTFAPEIKTGRQTQKERIAKYNADKVAWEAANPGQVYRRGAPEPLAPTARKTSAARHALIEIRHYQNYDRAFIPKLAFQQVALQEAAEAHRVAFSEAANMCTVHAKPVTIQDKDMKLVTWFAESPSLAWQRNN